MIGSSSSGIPKPLIKNAANFHLVQFKSPFVQVQVRICNRFFTGYLLAQRLRRRLGQCPTLQTGSDRYPYRLEVVFIAYLRSYCERHEHKAASPINITTNTYTNGTGRIKVRHGYRNGAPRGKCHDWHSLPAHRQRYEGKWSSVHS